VSTPSLEGCSCTPFESRWDQRHGECIVVSSDADGPEERAPKLQPTPEKARRTTRLNASNIEGLKSLGPSSSGRLGLDKAFGGLMEQSGSYNPFPLFVAVPIDQSPAGHPCLKVNEPRVCQVPRHATPTSEAR